jgi:hypothetical protein
MALDVQSTLDFGGARRIVNLPDAVNPQEPATLAQLRAQVEGLAWKDNARVATQGNISLASPGATIDGITMVANDRVLVRANTAPAENGIYIWNGAAVPMTRSLDANSAEELESAVVTVDEGTSAGSTFRQSTVNFVLGTGGVVWGSFGTAAGPASDTSAGVAELATQAEVDAGTDTTRIVTPARLAASPFASRRFAANFGDGSATSYVLTHNLNTFDVQTEVFRNSGNRDTVLVEVRRTSVNAVTIITDTPPAVDAFRCVIRG